MDRESNVNFKITSIDLRLYQ